jgi:hypothetical protein
MFAFAIILYRWFMLAFNPLFALPSDNGGLASESVNIPSVIQPQSNSSDSNTETLANRIAELEELMHQASFQPTQYVAASKEPKIHSPSPFKGNKAEAEEFILKCQAIFDICTRTYSNDKTKLAFVFNLLQGDAYQWIKPALLTKEKPAWVTTWEDFKLEFFKYFADSDVKEVSRHKLKSLKQSGSVSSYATDFKKYVDSVQTYKPLTQAEKDLRRKNNLCLYCGKPGHRVENCRSKPSSQRLSAIEGIPTSGKENPHQ